MKKRSVRNVLNIAVLLLLIVLTFYYLLRDRDLGELSAILRSASLPFVLLGIFLMCFYVFAEAWCTHSILFSLGSPTSIFKCIKYALVGFYFSAITPSASGGQPMQLFYMSSDRIPMAHSSLALILLTVAYKIALLLFGAVLLLFPGGFLTETLGAVFPLFVFGVSFNLVTVVFLFVVVFSQRTARFACHKIVRFLAWIRILKHPENTLKKLEIQLESYQNGAIYLKTHPFLLVKVTLITVLQRFAIFLVTYCVYRALGLSEMPLLQIVLLQSVISISVDMLPFPGGAGITEVCFVEIFTSIFGVLLVPGLLLSRGITYYVFLLISGIAVCIAQLIHIRKKPQVD